MTREKAAVKLEELIHHNLAPKPWEAGDNLPWNEPAFSTRMLREHLSQAHDRASRRFEIIDRHVEWIHHVLLDEEPVSVLDLACGPGLYSCRLTSYGHVYRGIDFSPASITYAQQMTQPEQARCSFELNDIREAEYGSGYGLVMLIFGEFTVFRPSDAKIIVQKAFDALDPWGKLLLEVSTFEAVIDLGNKDNTWYSSQAGLFSDKPHLVLKESFNDPERSVSTNRYYVVDLKTTEVEQYSVYYQGYTQSDLQKMLQGVGFENVEFHSALDPSQQDEENEFMVVTASKPA